MSAFKPMLAKEAKLDKLKFPLTVQAKLDGIRAAVVDGKLLSRTLKPIPNAEIRAALENPWFEGLDGEIVVGPITAKDAYRRTSSFVMAESKTGEPWAFHVFDKWDTAYDYPTRFQVAASIVAGKHEFDGIPVFVVPCETVRNAAELERYEDRIVEAGGEGIIARVPDAPYKFGRSGSTGPLLKIKRFTDFEAKVVGVYEEQHNANEATTNELGRIQRSSHKAGKVGKGTLGGLILRAVNGPWEGVEFRCGTGFNAQQRAEFWALAHDSADVFPEFAKIKAFEIGAKDAPRFPVFLGWRDRSDFDG